MVDCLQQFNSVYEHLITIKHNAIEKKNKCVYTTLNYVKKINIQK